MPKPRELLFSVGLADCELETFTVGGHGGSGKDTSNTGVRLRHRASGAVGEGREERSQLANKRAAFRRMVNTNEFKRWHRIETARRLGSPSIDDQVERLLAPEHLRIEVRTPKGWQPE